MSDSYKFVTPAPTEVEQAEVTEEAEVSEDAAEKPPRLKYSTADEFVREHLRYKYRRSVGRAGRADFRWLAAWWKSEEAISRITALWRTWEKARLDPLEMSDWWITHCDRQMAVLLSTTGPFAHSQDENKPGDPLPYTPAPENFFPSEQPPDTP